MLKGWRPTPQIKPSPASGVPERHRSTTPMRLLGVLLEVWFESYRYNPVRLTSCRLNKLGISRLRKYRGLKLLEEAGFISVVPIRGANPLVVLNWLARKDKTGRV